MVEQDIEFVTFDGDTITKSDYRDDLINHYIQSEYDGLTKITDFTVGSEAYHLADLMASIMLEKREDIDSNYRMCMIHFMEGEFLDNEGDRVGVHREQSSPSTGEVTFTLKYPSSDIVTIPADTVVATDDAISFILVDDVTIYPGDTTGSGEVLCEQEGEYTNVLPGTVNIIISDLNIFGLSVTNEDYFAEGADVEDDDDYRARLLAAPASVPCGSTPWFERVCMNDENVGSSVHDVICRKNVAGYSEDMVIYFRARNEEDTVVVDGETVTVAYKDLNDLFSCSQFDIVGINLAFEQGEHVTVLPDSETISGDSVEYLYAVVLEDDAVLADVKEEITDVIEGYNTDACLGTEFSPDALVAEIEEGVEDVFRCRIVLHNITQSTYSEITSNNYNIYCNDDEYYRIDITDIADRITEASFSIDLSISN